MSTLVVYYSLSCGNTKRVAEMVADALDADIEVIETVEPYPGDYQEVVDQGKREVERGYKPAIEALEFNPADYERIVIGTPTWWYTMAPAVATYLSEYDWRARPSSHSRRTAVGRGRRSTTSWTPAMARASSTG